MEAKFIFFIALVAVSLARPEGPQYGRQSAYQQEGPAKYDFDWSVDDDASYNNFGQQESRDGDNTQGSYYVLLPDGRTQKVTYSVNGDSGFIADVTYEGEAKYEQPQSYKPQQAYKPQSKPTY